MKERGILFSGAMVRALLAGTKTQTRRLVTHRSFRPSDTPGFTWTFRDRHGLWHDVTNARMLELCPHGAAGDRLWVRETWGLHDTLPSDGPEHATIFYRATDGEQRSMRNQLWRSPIHMPRWASRIVLEIVGVRIERVRSITEEDACAEGVEPFFTRFPEIGRGQRLTSGELALDSEHRASFACTWDEIHGGRDGALWLANPWVWVLDFARRA